MFVSLPLQLLAGAGIHLKQTTDRFPIENVGNDEEDERCRE